MLNSFGVHCCSVFGTERLLIAEQTVPTTKSPFSFCLKWHVRTHYEMPENVVVGQVWCSAAEIKFSLCI